MPSLSNVADRLVTLRGGLVVPLAALQVAWSLEDRGARFELADDDRILVRPASVLTDEDRQNIQRWRGALRAIVAYEVPDDARA